MPREIEILLRRYVLYEPGEFRLSPRDSRNLIYQREREGKFVDPDVERIVPYAFFSHFEDSLRKNHKALHGGIARIDWTGWNRCAPPLGPGCNCEMIHVTTARAKKLLASGPPYFDLMVAPPVDAGPDKGWERRDGWWEEFRDYCRSRNGGVK